MSPTTWLRGVCLCGTLFLLGGLPSRSADNPDEVVDLTLAPGGERVINSLGMRLVRIKAGRFMMGAPDGDANALAHEKPRHEVEITKDFYLGATEVTQKQYKELMGYNPSYFSRDGKGAQGESYPRAPGGGKDALKGVSDRDLDDFPVEHVSWDNAKQFIDKLNARPEEMRLGRTYRLPTEAEWEYACRAGERAYRKWHTGNDLPNKLANYNDSLRRACKVGSYPPNDFGIHDMHGSNWEWCADWHDANYYANSPKRDPQGPRTGTNRILRGGCWNNENGKESSRTAYRLSWGPTQRNYDVGFRVVLVVK